jgi:general secretion pathway protein K
MSSGVAVARQQCGVALAVVVWFLAGMSLLVAGIVAGSRGDVRLARIHAEKARVTAASDGAINLLVADLLDGYFAEGGRPTLAAQRYDIGPQAVSVVAVPVSWLVDINAAPLELLATGVAATGAVDAERARALAGAVVQWRSAQPGSGRAQRFSATEDLLGVAGMDRATLDGVRDFLAEPAAGSGLSQWGPPARQSLEAVFKLSPHRRVVATVNSEGSVPGGAGAVDVQVVANLAQRAGAYRVDAIVETDGKHWLRRRWIDTSLAARGAPWRHVRTEPVRVIGS